MNYTKPKTIFCDIDGTLVKHYPPDINSVPDFELTLLPGTLETFREWDRKGYNIILVTGRRESMRHSTEKQLKKIGIFYDQLIMGIGGGQRVIINDFKPNSDEPTAAHFCLKRNDGISSLNL
jgi:hydroxymethylpyrimidine pyrophosphatase-like HAD family hydrolase